MSLGPPVREAASHLNDLAEAFSVFPGPGASLEERTRALLKARALLPTIIFVDGFEHAESSHALWLDYFLQKTLYQPLLRMVIAGRRVPQPGSLPWAIYAERIHCDPLADPTVFVQHGAACGSAMPPDEINSCCRILRNMRDHRKQNGQPTDGLSPLALLTEISNRRSLRATA